MTGGGFSCKIHRKSAYSAGVHLCMRAYVLRRHVDTSFVPLQSWCDRTREERWRAAPWLLAGSTTSQDASSAMPQRASQLLTSGRRRWAPRWTQSGSFANNARWRDTLSAYWGSKRVRMCFRGDTRYICEFSASFYSRILYWTTLMLMRKYTKQAKFRELYLIIRKKGFTFSLWNFGKSYMQYLSQMKRSACLHHARSRTQNY